MTTEKEIHIWCPECGHGSHHIVNVDAPAPPYTITDAQADAAVLRKIEEYVSRNEKTETQIIQIETAIINRLHAFYCGKEGEK